MVSRPETPLNESWFFDCARNGMIFSSSCPLKNIDGKDAESE
jgi:hypothetical protein